MLIPPSHLAHHLKHQEHKKDRYLANRVIPTISVKKCTLLLHRGKQAPDHCRLDYFIVTFSHHHGSLSLKLGYFQKTKVCKIFEGVNYLSSTSSLCDKSQYYTQKKYQYFFEFWSKWLNCFEMNFSLLVLISLAAKTFRSCNEREGGGERRIFGLKIICTRHFLETRFTFTFL